MQHSPQFIARVTILSELYSQGMKSFTSAGIIVAELVDTMPHAYAAIRSVTPHMSEENLSMLEKLGRGTLCLELMVSRNPGATMLRKMPIEIQRKYCAEKIPVLLPDGDLLMVHYSHLTQAQVAQVNGFSDIRQLHQQKVHMVSRTNQAKDKANKKKPLFYLENGRLFASAKGSMSGAELLAFARAYNKYVKDQSGR